MHENNINLNIWSNLTSRPKIGEILMQQKKITVDQLGIALDIQLENNSPLGEILIKMGVITMEDLLKALDLQVNIDRLINSKQ